MPGRRSAEACMRPPTLPLLPCTPQPCGPAQSSCLAPLRCHAPIPIAVLLPQPSRALWQCPPKACGDAPNALWQALSACMPVCATGHSTVQWAWPSGPQVLRRARRACGMRHAEGTEGASDAPPGGSTAPATSHGSEAAPSSVAHVFNKEPSPSWRARCASPRCASPRCASPRCA